MLKTRATPVDLIHGAAHPSVLARALNLYFGPSALNIPVYTIFTGLMPLLEDFNWLYNHEIFTIFRRIYL